MNAVIGVETMGVGVFMTSTLVVASVISMVEVFVPRQTSTPVTVPSIGGCSMSAVPADNNLLVRGMSHV